MVSGIGTGKPAPGVSLVVMALALALALGGLSLSARPAESAATLPDGFTDEKVAGGLVRPTAMAFAPDGRIFVAQQGGKLRVIEDGTLLQEPFVSLRVHAEGERGLLGVALHPNFETNRYVYLYRTTRGEPRHNEIVRFTASGDKAERGSYRRIFRLNNLSDARNHNGGALHFGEDGKLYAAVGDNARPQSAQRLGSLFGKMLRIKPNGTIPKDNPFFAKASGKNRAIWARGLRNPFSFAVQPDTGIIHINDVGQQTWEEINRGAAGANYGWPEEEGEVANPRFEPPIFAYSHDATGTEGGCAITGGTFYNPETVQFPTSYLGDYFFADYCRGWIRRYDPETDAASYFAGGIAAPVDLQVGPEGAIYYLARGAAPERGSVHRIVSGAP